jgi:hypothetical protein
VLLWNPKDGGHPRGPVGISGLVLGFFRPRVNTNLLLRACLMRDTTLMPFLLFPLPVVSFTSIAAEALRLRPPEAPQRTTSC